MGTDIMEGKRNKGRIGGKDNNFREKRRIEKNEIIRT